MSQHEKIFPAPDTLNDVEYGKFVLANLAAKRAKQIKEGAPPLVRIDSSHPLSIALEEIAQGKIKPILGADAQQAELEEDYSVLDDLGLEDVGILLPGVDDDDDDDTVDIDLDDLGLDDDDDDDDDEDGEIEIKAPSLGDLLEDDSDDDDDVSDDSDDDEKVESSADMSLDDLADEEESDSDEDSDD